MAIGDRATASSETSGFTTLTYAHTVAGSADLCIWVMVDSFRSGGSSDPTGVTYAGSAATELADFLGGGANDNACSLWRRIAPSTGANNVVVTHSAAHDIVGMSISYSGVDGTTPNDTVQELDSTSTTPSHAVTSETGDEVVTFAFGYNWAAASATGGQTLRLENDNNTANQSIVVGTAAGAASVTCSWSFGAFYDDPHGLMSFNINQATGAAADQEPSLVGGKLVRHSLLLKHMIGRGG